MYNKMKRFTALLLTIAMMISMLPTGSFAATYDAGTTPSGTNVVDLVTQGETITVGIGESKAFFYYGETPESGNKWSEDSTYFSIEYTVYNSYSANRANWLKLIKATVTGKAECTEKQSANSYCIIYDATNTPYHESEPDGQKYVKITVSGQKNSATIKFDTVSGSSLEFTKLTAKAGETITLPTGTRDGYVLSHWLDDATGNKNRRTYLYSTF